MKRIWAPWRINYFKNFKNEKGCLFCRVFKSKDDGKNLVVFKTRHSLVMLNLYPYNNGHLMIAPKKHVPSIELLNSNELADLMSAVQKSKRLLDRVLKPQGYNIGMNIGRVGGAGFDEHLHMHIVPRWNGDSNFMATCSATRVISQSLKTLHRELKKAL
jgi:ATP adenylyltransferase